MFDSGSSPRRYHLVLVHGTAARGAPWTRHATSKLCKHLKGVAGLEPTFSYSDWTGSNTRQARVDGAEKLRADEHVRNAADGTLVLVGHSHGGSVIAQALVDDEQLCKRTAGVVFMATPFVHARLLPMAGHLPKGPALLAGFSSAILVIVCGIALLASAGWPDRTSVLLNAVALGLPYIGLLTWWKTSVWAGRLLGNQGGDLSVATRGELSARIGQLDMAVLEKRGVNHRALLLRSTADEAASGLATAQLLGRIASDLPALTWKLPGRLGTKLRSKAGFDGKEPPRWFLQTFAVGMSVVALAFAISGAAALLPHWEALLSASTVIQDTGERALEALLMVFTLLFLGVISMLLLAVPLLLLGLPIKLFASLLYGIRGWPVFKSMFVELSVEPAPPGAWLVHQFDANVPEGAAAPPTADSDHAEQARRRADTVLAHSFVYDDPRAHRDIAAWLLRGCRWS